MRLRGDDINLVRGVGIVGDFFRFVLYNYLYVLGYIKSLVDNIDIFVYYWYVKFYWVFGERGLGVIYFFIVFGIEIV